MAIYQTKIEREPLEKKTLKSKIVAVSICLDQPPPRHPSPRLISKNQISIHRVLVK